MTKKLLKTQKIKSTNLRAANQESNNDEAEENMVNSTDMLIMESKITEQTRIKFNDNE